MLSIQPVEKFFLSFTFLSLAFMQPVLAQEKLLKTITVTGQGIERIPTTVANVQLGVEIEGKNAPQIQEEVAKRSTFLIELLKSSNVQKLQTSGIQLRPNYSYENNQRQLIGYVATNIVSFESPIEKVGRLLDDTVKIGATRIDNVNLTATETAITTAQKQALIKASLDAQQQGEVVLNALNLTAKEIITINVNGANVPNPIPIPREIMADKLASSSPSSTPVVAGEQTVSASVTLQIRY
ncbi:MAG: SIMPL domain-containing protein [Cyanobacteria bacterium]|nr:SIMPL domain-containing protein [Cyanobacteria bacterium CG_2015-16_32_12]NCO76740.1 SIMPL domain-containing protein [Cyanobacteria bacterium CG_2015-22_32_23]NCQ04386.1 SIMPL domain-containing protein [Cyanobacteria bacterium CG_2015-09_32_10]NCQ42998.1 SIMPL domain-containing protein [Cyanobacteria bacterium CG_2015-04_32_10]NCS84399.1 SIMPL domain-containing protein [Cyanobacteria bacterium CG_2015-02_32_10]